MEDESPREKQVGKRAPDGRFLEPPPGAAPPFPKGTSGNPKGRPRGYVDITKRVANYLGAEDNWPSIKRLLDTAIKQAEVEVGLRALNMGIQNSHAILKATDEALPDAEPPIVQLEEGKEGPSDG